MSEFDDLAAQAEANPTGADFAKLRAAYVVGDAYRPLKHITRQKLMQITDSVTDFDEVVRTCQDILKSNPLDLEARMMLAHAQEKSGDGAAAEKSHTFAERMLDAILATGDGKSFETAFHLVAENEAWTVMRTFGIKARSRERHRRDDRVFDVFEGKIGRDDVTVHFDVTDPVRVLDETLERTDGE
jgi:hypothetical protein